MNQAGHFLPSYAHKPVTRWMTLGSGAASGPRVIIYRSSCFNPDEFIPALEVAAGIVDRLPNYLLREWKGAAR